MRARSVIHWIPIHMMHHDTNCRCSHLPLSLDVWLYNILTHGITNTEHAQTDMWDVYFTDSEWNSERREILTAARSSGAEGEGKWIKGIGRNTKRGEKEKGKYYWSIPEGDVTMWQICYLYGAQGHTQQNSGGVTQALFCTGSKRVNWLVRNGPLMRTATPHVCCESIMFSAETRRNNNQDLFRKTLSTSRDQYDWWRSVGWMSEF